MPNIQSAKRRVRVEAKATQRNRAAKSELKTLAKKFDEAVAAADKAAAGELFKAYTGALDKAKVKGTLHRNAVDRKKAQISKAMATIAE